MNKRFATMLAATAVLGVTTAFAANPFSDVTPSDWAYQSVSQLAAAGVINGYPDGTFKGQNNITRYEMAQMVAKAMANQARANAEQQAMINRLANEFASELNNLGVRVTALENKVGNVKVTGDARLRYQGTEDKNENGFSGDKKSKFDYRARVQFNATVNENTSAVVRLSSGNNEFGNTADTKVTIDRAYVAHQFGADTTAIAGRFNAFVGNGLIYDDTFDGAALTYNNGNFSALAAYGFFVEGDLKDMNLDADNNLSVTLLQAQGNLGEHATIGGFYAFANNNGEAFARNATFDLDGDSFDIYGGFADFHFNNVWIGGEYATFAEDSNKGGNDAWVAGIGFGNYDIKEAGSWDIKGQYFDLAESAPVFSSTWNQPLNRDYKGWLATVDYALAKNVGLSAYWAFNGENQDGTDVSDYYRAELNYKF